MDPKVKTLLASGAELTDHALERLLPSPDTLPHSIHRAMRHSVFAGGKRLRPILCMEAARMVAGNGAIPEGAADLGAALEMIHTYSLIHDDLPALDNDDLRRGQPTCHVVYGEAIAILAGDALQTLAFQTIAQLPAPSATVVAILKDVSLAIGTGVGRVGDLETALPPGMIGGQVVDIESEGKRPSGGPNSSGETTRKAPTAELVESIHRAKTGALITTSIVSGGLFGTRQMRGSMGLAGGKDRRSTESHTTAKARIDTLQKALREHHETTTDTIAHLRTFGEKAGLAFQIVDDVLDMTQSSEELGKTAGKDTATTKATWPAVYGIEKSLKDAEELIADAFAALAPFGAAADPLKSLAKYLVERKN
jgi:geranylgeranyl diphosphate synthase, type II